MSESELVLRALVALVLGAAIGVEREYHGHPAGLRTLALVAVGAAIFSEVGVALVGPHEDPTRIAAQVVTGVGFLGAGAILRTSGDVKGLTTASSVWVAAAIGMAAGFRFFLLATVMTVVVIAALAGLRPLARRLPRRPD